MPSEPVGVAAARPSSRWAEAVLSLLGLLAFLPPPALAAQESSATIRGQVSAGSSGHRLEGVQIRVDETDLAVRTDAEGRFRLDEVPVGDRFLLLWLPGTVPARVPVRVREGRPLQLDLRVDLDVIPLPALRVSAEPAPRGKMAGFHRRRARGFGTFVTREEIERRDPRETSDLLRTIPGVVVGSSGSPGLARVGIPRGSRDCTVAYFLDGMHVPGFHVDLVPPEDIEGIELYRGASQVPPLFRRRLTCAAVAIWTREPGN